ncbi:acetate--CoA ligase family protein [Pseudarthrobacter sp. AB1]|uniref:acetate--CoA ligase family protein n=1 Tax=Pseudarthrobacter sp. AB1 TaxID=2138309 RepID=UPI00186B631C|nr:acetate--CoA ligase family protein [Pseudarthrobacter sp. AB1]MBE4719532.1 hypothetical protein [Pseudarthrobacter sp. AB1]
MTISTERRTMERVFAPTSIVVVGASTNPGKRGNQVLRALFESGYTGAVYAVNPGGGSAHGVDFLTSIDDLPESIDLALVSLPAAATSGALVELADRDVAGAVLLASGFSETGASGAAAEAELQKVLEKTSLRVIGPNTSGFLNVKMGVNLVGVPAVKAGPIAILTQSGNMLLSLIADDKATHGPGVASYVGLGNQIDITYSECVEYFADDPNVGAIAIHSEGLRDGRSFLQAAVKVAPQQPLVMLRGGRSEIGRVAALSHTGSIAGSDEVAIALLGQAGVELVERSDELAIVAGVLATVAPLPYGTGVALLADGGGHATLAADALVAQNVQLSNLASDTEKELRQLLGDNAALNNPIDVAGATDSNPGLFSQAVEVLMRDPSVGLVLVIGMYGGYHERFSSRLREIEERDASQLVEIGKKYGKPFIVQSCYAFDRLSTHQVLRENGIPVIGSIDHAVRSVAALARRGKRLATASLRSSLLLPNDPATVHEEDPVLLSEPAARRLIESEGISSGDWTFASSAKELEAALRKFDMPCAVKIVADGVAHKSDVGGVSLKVTPGLATETWKRMVASVTAGAPEGVIQGMVVAPMAPSGVEVLVGARRDPIFGPIVAFGSGGFLVEALRDVSFRAAPLTHLEAEELIDETLASRLLDGYRNLLPIDRSAMADLLVAVGDLMLARPEIYELDLNPVIASGTELCPVDVRIAVRNFTL